VSCKTNDTTWKKKQLTQTTIDTLMAMACAQATVFKELQKTVIMLQSP
jgi:hypothetical protein